MVDGSYTWDIWVVRPLKACPGSNASGAPLWLEPTSFNYFWCMNLCFCCADVSHHMCLSIPEKPGSATHLLTSTASTGLLCPLVGTLMHFGLEGAVSQCMWLPPPINVCPAWHIHTAIIRIFNTWASHMTYWANYTRSYISIPEPTLDQS